MDVRVALVPPGSIRDHAASFAALINDAFPRPWAEVTRQLLSWYLIDHPFAVPGLATVATSGSTVVGCAIAIPRRLRWGQLVDDAYLISFVCVAPAFRGQQLASKLYDVLLGDVAARQRRVLTFAVEASAGARAIELAYPRNGFTGATLHPTVSFGGLRGQRLRSATGSDVASAADIHLDLGTGTVDYLLADPRGAVDVGGGMFAVKAWQLTRTDPEPILLLQGMRSAVQPDALRDAVSRAFDGFADHGRALVISNVQGPGVAVAESIGLRRLPGACYRPWLWSPAKNDPWLAAEYTSHAVT